MKCLENYTIKHVKEMSYEELKLLAEKVAKEEHENLIRAKLIEMLDIRDARNSVIEG
jgi:hypothetical protein